MYHYNDLTDEQKDKFQLAVSNALSMSKAGIPYEIVFWALLFFGFELGKKDSGVEFDLNTLLEGIDFSKL